MALFKISKGATGNLSNQSKVDGYCWFTPDDGKFYIDSTTSGSGTTLQRIPLNAERADKDGSGNIIKNNYAHSLTFDSANHALWLKDMNGNNLGSIITLGAMASVNSISTSYQPAGSNANSKLQITPTTTSVLSSVITSGAFPIFTSTVDANGVLSFSHSGGNFPTYNTKNVWNGYNTDVTASYAYGQIFSGTTATLTLSPVEGEAQNGDNRDF